MGLDIYLIQVNAWRVGERSVAGFSKIYPTPAAEEFTLGPARQGTGVVAAKVSERTRSRNAVHVLVDHGVLHEGTSLHVSPEHGTTDAIRIDIRAWVEEDPRRGGRSGTTSPASR